MQQRNILIKPIKLDHSNKKITEKGHSKVEGEQGYEEDILERADNNIINNKDLYNNDENFDDTSSVSSVDSDIGNFNIWDNSELSLRGINSEDLTDFYGKKLSFLQLFKLRSSFYAKGKRPTFKDIFKGAERVYRFCRNELSLDEFLKDENIERSVIQLDMSQDKNFAKFEQYFENNIELNSLKHREERYNRYKSPNAQRYRGNIRNSNGENDENISPQQQAHPNRIINGLNLSPRKPPKRQSEETKKGDMNLHQLSQMQKKQKQNITQTKLVRMMSQGDITPKQDNQQASNPISPVQSYAEDCSTNSDFTTRVASISINNLSPVRAPSRGIQGISPQNSQKQSSPHSSGNLNNHEFKLKLQKAQSKNSNYQQNEGESPESLQQMDISPNNKTKKKTIHGSDQAAFLTKKVFHEQKPMAQPSLFTQFIEKSANIDKQSQIYNQSSVGADFNSTSRSLFGVSKGKHSPTKQVSTKLPEIDLHKARSSHTDLSQSVFNKQQGFPQGGIARHPSGDLFRSSTTFMTNDQNGKNNSKEFKPGMFNAPSSLLPLQPQNQQDQLGQPVVKGVHRKYQSHHIMPEDIKKVQANIHTKF